MDHIRIPLNAIERGDRQGDIPYWGANGVVDYVDDALLDERVLLVGEDGAPFFESSKDVAFISDGPIWPNNHIHILIPDKRVLDERFLCYFLNQVEFAEYINGSTRDKLTQAQLGSILVSYPGRREQTDIADFLDRETGRIAHLISKKLRLIGLLAERHKSFTVSEVTGRGTEELEGTGIGPLPRAPAHWQVRRIASIFRESLELGGDNLPILSVSINWGISDRELDDEDRHRVVSHIEDRNSYKRVRTGDLVYNMMRAWQGAFGVARVDGLVSPAYVVARPTEQIHAPYFEHLLRTPMWIEEFRRVSKGIADFRQRLYWEHFRQVRVVLPPFDEQMEISERIARNDRAVSETLAPLQKSIDRLRELRSALITAAVTGKIDVNTWGKKGQTDRRLDQIEEAMRA